MPRGLEARGYGAGSSQAPTPVCCEVRCFVLTPPDLSWEDQGPTAILGLAVQAEVGRSSPSQLLPHLRSPGSRAAPWLFGRLPWRLLSGQSPASALGHRRPASWGPAWPQCPVVPRPRAALEGLGAFYTWRSIGTLATPFRASFVPLLLLGAVNIFNPVHMASSSDPEAILSLVSPHPCRTVLLGCFQTQAPTDQIKTFCFVLMPPHLSAAPPGVPGFLPPLHRQELSRGPPKPALGGAGSTLAGEAHQHLRCSQAALGTPGLRLTCAPEGLGVWAGQRLEPDRAVVRRPVPVHTGQHLCPAPCVTSAFTGMGGGCLNLSAL